MSENIEKAKLLRSNDYVVLNLGYGANEKVILTGFKVMRTNFFTMAYNFIEQGAISSDLAPNGMSNVNFTPYYTEIVKLPLSKIQNVTDMFLLDKQNEMLQVFYGISPSYLRVIPRQPDTMNEFYMDQQITPSSNFISLGIDGFMSPFDSPAQITETFILAGLSVGITLENPVTIPINPTLNFWINRMLVEPITDSATIMNIIKGKIKGHIATVSSTFDSNVSTLIQRSKYPGIQLFEVDLAGGAGGE